MSYILFLLIWVLLASSLWASLSLAPWVPAEKRDLKRINKIFSESKKKNFIELGSGDSRVLLFLAKNNPEAYFTGIEMSLFFYLVSLVRIKISGLRNAKIIFGNALKTNLREYDFVYVFGLTRTLDDSLYLKLDSELKTGSYVTSYTFPFQDRWPKINIKSYHQVKRSSIYVYCKETK